MEEKRLPSTGDYTWVAFLSQNPRLKGPGSFHPFRHLQLFFQQVQTNLRSHRRGSLHFCQVRVDKGETLIPCPVSCTSDVLGLDKSLSRLPRPVVLQPLKSRTHVTASGEPA